MKRWVWLVTGIFLISTMVAFAQDPGDPDSLIISGVDVDYDPSGTFVYIPLYFVTDDYIGFVNLPITWNSSDGEIFPGATLWRDVFFEWDEVYDTLLLDEALLRQVAWHDIGGEPNPPLYTDGERLHGISLRFVITADAEPQFVTVDTTCDPRNGSIEFGDTLGVITFVPTVVSGYLRYGEVGIDDVQPLPTEFALKSNYPNPFNPYTKIDFDLPNPELVNIKIYNILGQNVRTLISDYKEAGYHSVVWDGLNNTGRICPSGVYFYRMTAGDFSETKKMMLIR